MKYEYLCGDEALFDGAPEDSVIAIKRPFIRGVRSEKMYFFSSAYDAIVGAGSLFNFNNVILRTDEYAERRIIKEPKRWTWEDKKAGVLPEVGADVSSVAYGYVCSVVAIDSNSRHIWCQFPDQSVGSCMIFEINPIETPAEKAARLKSEWCAKAAKQLKNLEYTSTLTSIYDALLSGELAAPKVGE